MQGSRDSGAARLHGVGGRSSGEGLPFRVGSSPRAGCQGLLAAHNSGQSVAPGLALGLLATY